MATIASRPALLDWSVVRGDDVTVTLTFTTAAGASVDLSGRSYTAQVLNDATLAPVATITVGTGSAGVGVLTLSLSDTATGALTLRTYRWRLVETYAGSTATVLDGGFRVADSGSSGVKGGTSSATVVRDTQTVTVTTGAGAGGSTAPDYMTKASSVSVTPAASKPSNIVVERLGSFFMKGFNIGHQPNAPEGKTFANQMAAHFWTDAWDEDRFLGNITRVATYGGNTIRVIGSYKAYVQDADTYRSRWVQLIEHARTQGLKVVYLWLDGFGDQSTATGEVDSTNYIVQSNLDNLVAYMQDLIGQPGQGPAGTYAQDPLFLYWGADSEMTWGSDEDADPNRVVCNFVDALKAIDPVTPVAYSIPAPSSNQDINTTVAANIAAHTNTLPDIYAWHVYIEPQSTSGYSPYLYERMRWWTPDGIAMVMDEFGSGLTAPSPAGPAVNATMQAQIVDSWGQVLGSTDMIGLCLWQLEDDNVTSQYGAFDNDHVARPLLDAWRRLPDRRSPHLRNAGQFTTLFVDNFSRANGSVTADTVVARGPGDAPSNISGSSACSIASGRLTFSSVSGAINYVVWDVGTGEIDVEATFAMTSSGAYNHGVILNWVDANNFITLAREWDGSGTPLMRFVVWSGGSPSVSSNLSTELSTFADRLRLARKGGNVYAWWLDRLVYEYEGLSQGATSGKVGWYAYGGSAAQNGQLTGITVRMPVRSAI